MHFFSLSSLSPHLLAHDVEADLHLLVGDGERGDPCGLRYRARAGRDLPLDRRHGLKGKQNRTGARLTSTK